MLRYCLTKGMSDLRFYSNCLGYAELNDMIIYEKWNGKEVAVA
jgi:hypothetical protein